MKHLCIGAALALMVAEALFAADFDRPALHRARFDLYPPERQSVQSGSGYTRTAATISVLDDIAISESVAPARFDQADADIVGLSDSGWLVVWDDDRDGVRKIFWQRYSLSGAPSGSNVLIAGSVVGADYVEPRIETDTLGRVYLFYRDRTNGLIYGSRYSSSLAIDIPTYLVNDTAGDAFAGPFDIAVYPNGRVVVTWEEYVSEGSGIRARIVSSTGTFVTAPMPVNSDVGSVSHWVPSVAVEPNAGFLVAWEDYRNGNADIYTRLFDGTGAPLGTEFSPVPSPFGVSDQYTPQVTFLTTDQYAVGWVDLRLGQDIYVQIFNTNTGLVGANRLVSAGDGVTAHWDLDMSADPAGRLAAAWASFAAESDIVAQRFDIAANPIDTPAVHNSAAAGQRWSPAIAYSGQVRYAVVWSEVLTGQADISLMAFDSAAVPQYPSEVTVNDDLIGAESSSPALAFAGDWYTLCTYADRRRDNGDVYLRSITHALEPLSESRRVNQDNGTALQSEPAIDAVLNDEALVVWIDGRSVSGQSGQRIFARYANRWGGFVGAEFTVSDSAQATAKSSPQAAINSSRRALVIWLDKRAGTFQVYGRWLNPDHSRDGSEFLISDGSAGIAAGSLRAATAGDNRYFASWLNVDATPVTVQTVWYRADKSRGGSFDFAPVLAGGGLSDFSIDGYGDGTLALAWCGLENSVRRLYLSVFDSLGNLLGGASDMVTDSDNAAAESPSVSVDENDYVSLAWTDYRDGRAVVYYQVLDETRTPVGVNEPVGSAAVEIMKTPSTASARGRAWFGWIDNRANGFNVYGATTLYLPTDVDDTPEQVLPGSFVLAQNYPNPFNPATTISFALPAASRARLAILNTLGQEVRVLVDQSLPAGQHEVVWDGTDSRRHAVSSGVYFYRLESLGFTDQKKMILLK